MIRTRVLDWGSYLFWDKSVQFDWPLLHQQADVQCAIFKGNETDFANEYSTVVNVAAARLVLPIVGCYYWHDPTADPKYLIDLYSRAIDREKPDFIAVDTEQQLDGGGHLIDPAHISDTGQALCLGLKARYPQKRVIDYTRRDFVNSYAPGMLKWLPTLDGTWWAGGPDYGCNRYRLDYSQILLNLSHQWCSPWTADSFRWVDLSTMTPSLPNGFTSWTLWQYSGRILLPAGTPVEYDHQYDWSFYNGSLDDLLIWAGLKAVVIPPLPLTLEQKVAALETEVKHLDPGWSGF